jgi:hypothetical protein
VASQYSKPVTLDSGLVALAFRALHEPRGRFPFLERILRRRRKAPVRVGGVVLSRSMGRGQHVVIVRRGETELFNTLQREFGEVPQVQVIWDRRTRDRRAARPGARGIERRGRDRRSRPPAIWQIQGYLLVPGSAGAPDP